MKFLKVLLTSLQFMRLLESNSFKIFSPRWRNLFSNSSMISCWQSGCWLASEPTTNQSFWLIEHAAVSTQIGLWATKIGLENNQYKTCWILRWAFSHHHQIRIGFIIISWTENWSGARILPQPNNIHYTFGMDFLIIPPEIDFMIHAQPNTSR